MNFEIHIKKFYKYTFAEDMQEDDGMFGLDETTVSLICGLSVLSVVIVFVALGIIGFFIKVRFIDL